MFFYYIYYRVDGRHAQTLEVRIRNMQAEMRERTGVCGRLLKKCGEPLLWMEVYESINDPANFEQALADVVEKYSINDCLQPGSSRKTECFSG